MPVHQLQTTVTNAIDRLDLHATAPTLLLELQGRLGKLGAEALRLTANGRRPFRPDVHWGDALGNLMFTVLSLADQTGVDLNDAVTAAITRLEDSVNREQVRQSSKQPDWP